VTLAPLDWAVIALYLAFALCIGFWVRERASQGRESYFLAGRTLPWWWAGTSIAATTFAADTPLAITGIVADRGLSGNWLWLSWIGVHAAVIVYFATKWRRSRTLTDAELIQLRYSGRAADALRVLRALLYALVYNAIVLGWVLRAMGKVAHPIFRWTEWAPGLTGALAKVWPASSALGSPSEGLTILALVGVVALYSSLGGIRGVILTDLVQFAMALLGSIWLAVVAWHAVGGQEGLLTGLNGLYGEGHQYLRFFPSRKDGWLAALRFGPFMVGAYLIVQSYANIPADGGGYLMQRLATCRDEADARKAAAWFTVLHYLVRVWPWFIVATAALVLIPLGHEAGALGGAGALAQGDREMAYTVLLFALLPAGVLGLMVASLLAAFMSTVDTHFNWGASYVVNDLYLRWRPRATPEQQVRLARLSVVGFAALSVVVALHIDTIEQAWKWVAFIGAALGVPTALRWVWWRVNAASELAAVVSGLTTAALVSLFTAWSYETQLVATSAASVVGMAAAMWLGPPTSRAQLASFQAQVRPLGVWPGRSPGTAVRDLLRIAAPTVAVIAGVVGLLRLGTWLIFQS